MGQTELVSFGGRGGGCGGSWGLPFFKIKKHFLRFSPCFLFFYILSNFAICFHGVGGDRGALE
jgi:hypothetical protein